MRQDSGKLVLRSPQLSFFHIVFNEIGNDRERKSSQV